MKERNFDIAELEAILAMPADHPRRVDLEADPGFRAAVRSYQQFVAAGEQPADASAAQAEAKLADFIDEMVGAGTAAVPARPWYQSLRPYLVGGLAAAVLAAIFLTTRDDYQPPTPGQALRWEEGETAAVVALVDGTPVAVDGDSLRIMWHRLPGADGYAVEFYRSDLIRVANRDAATDTALTVGIDGLRTLFGTEDSGLFRVLAIADADTIARSAPGVIAY